MSKKRNFSSNFSNPTRLVVKEEVIMGDTQDQITSDDQQLNTTEDTVIQNDEQTVSSELEVVEQPVDQQLKVEEKKAVQPTVVKKAVANTTTNVDVDIVIEDNRNGTNQFNKTVISFLDKYVANMAPGVPIDPKEGGNYQHSLYATINQILNQSTFEGFKSAFGLLIAYIVKHKEGVFGEKYAFRFAEEWPSGADRLTNFHAILNLLMIISNLNERPVHKFVSLERTFNTGFSETAKDNIMRFIGR